MTGTWIIIVLSGWIAMASVAAAALYAVDKHRAVKGTATGKRGRVPERVLLAWSIVGGWPGGWIAGRVLGHKTRKFSYRLRFALCVLIHVTGLILIGLAWSGVRIL